MLSTTTVTVGKSYRFLDSDNHEIEHGVLLHVEEFNANPYYLVDTAEGVVSVGVHRVYKIEES